MMVDGTLAGRRSWLGMAALAMLSSTAWTVPGRASEFPAVLPLSSIDAATGLKITHTPNPILSNDYYGRSVVATDFNGDGLSDVVIGPGGFFPPDPSPYGTAGSVVFGSKDLVAAGSIDTSDLNGSNGFRFCATPQNQCNPDVSNFYAMQSVAGAGDVNGDGFGDFLIAANNSGNEAFDGFVVFGRPGHFPKFADILALDGSNGFSFSEDDRTSCDNFLGVVVAGGGDVNGDGFDDVLVSDFGACSRRGAGTAGATYVVFGKAAGFASSVNVSKLNGRNGFRISGTTGGEYTGWSLAMAGDINGDSYGDIVIGAVNDGSGPPYPGEVFVVFGKAGGFGANIDLSDLDGKNGFKLVGAPPDRVGYNVAGVGDVNGDGLADFNAGCHIVFGKRSRFAKSIVVSSLSSQDGFRLKGFGCEGIVRVGDLNADGFDDLSTGQTILFGKRGPFDEPVDPANVDGSNGFHVQYSGILDGAQDFNGDGIGDLLAVTGSGGATVIYGRLPDEARWRIGAEGNQHISGGAFDDRLSGRGGDDVLEGRGGGDALDGGLGIDTASYRHAAAGVRADLSHPALSSGDAAGDTFSSIENLEGSGFDDILAGNGLGNRISGHSGDDKIFGHGGSDRLLGNGGKDVLRGGAGPDQFVYRALSDSRVGARRDVIADFNAGQPGAPIDQIDLRGIDALPQQPGDQAFSFIGEAPFSNTAGELRVSASGSSVLVSGDVTGDGVADFEIELGNFANLAGLSTLSFRL